MKKKIKWREGHDKKKRRRRATRKRNARWESVCRRENKNVDSKKEDKYSHADF